MKKITGVLLVLLLMTAWVAYAADGGVPSSWAREGIDTAQEVGILESGEEYVYQEPITREAFCTLMYRYVRLWGVDTEETDALFSDTDSLAVAKLYNLGIINGKGDTVFAPHDFLTREEAAAILCRAIRKTVPVPVTELYYVFDDQEDISGWAMESVQIMCNMGIMNGVGNNVYAPQDAYTAEEAIVTIVRVLERQESF